jgi:tetraacyldisaccharide 4'-kinase
MMRWAVRVGWIPSQSLGIRVISVGNLQIGGAGKTPIVAQIAREAISRGLTVCILSRGYQSNWEKKGGVLSPESTFVSANQVGDEPALLHFLCPEAFIGVGADRWAVFRQVQALAKKGIDLVILDDGFQHWRIQKDLEILAVTSSQWGDVIFRDAPSALKKADLIVWTKGARRPISFGKPLVKVRYALKQAIKLPSEKLNLWLITGVADGQSVYQLMVDSGFQVQRHIQLGDHWNYSKHEVMQWLQQAQQQRCQIALTGKDWVKWRDFGITQNDVMMIEPDLVFEEGEEIWEKVLWGE